MPWHQVRSVGSTVLLALLAAACSAAAQPNPTPTSTPVAATRAPVATPAPTPRATPSPTPEPTIPPLRKGAGGAGTYHTEQMQPELRVTMPEGWTLYFNDAGGAYMNTG